MMRTLRPILILLLVLAAPLPAAAISRVQRASQLYAIGLRHLNDSRVDMRRQALSELESAVRLDPSKPEYERALAQASYDAGFLKQARLHFESVIERVPDDAEACYGLALIWRRDWLKFLDSLSLVRAAEFYSRTARLDSKRCDAWLGLVPLLLAQGETRAAWAAAMRAREADPQRLDGPLADACTSYRLGRLARAESLFVATVPKLRRNVRARFEDIAPLASERDTFHLHRLPAAEQERFIAGFWKEHDPDLVTRENEAQLEYWARVATAYFLYYDTKRREWDERGEVYVRYGPPARMLYNPVTSGAASFSYGTGPAYPLNLLVWEYPELGMTVTMQDRTLNEFYRLPISTLRDMDPLPNPDSLAKLGDRLATNGGRGVFPMLPPEAKSRPIDGVIARFETSVGTRLLAQIETPGGPADDLVGEWVVLDSTRTEVARGRRALSPSACEPTEAQVAEFASEVPPGNYLVGLSVRDPSGARGLQRVRVNVPEPGPALAISDIVVVCGLPPAGLSNVQLNANPSARVEGPDPLTAYFEVSHLVTGQDGRARFEYEYVVKSALRDPRVWLQRLFAPRREPPPVSATRRDEQAGGLRRQFVSVPVQSLPAGRYRLEITVRDLNGGGEIRGSAEFERANARGRESGARSPEGESRPKSG